MKRILLILTALFLANSVYAYKITCPYSDVNEKAKGTYVFNFSNRVIYELNDKKINIEKYRTELLQTQTVFIPFYMDKTFEPKMSHQDFIQFDRHGNAYILYGVNTSKGRKIAIFKYDPVNDKGYIFEIDKTNPFGMGFAVSDDGKFLFVSYLDENVSTQGYPTVAVISTDNPEDREVLLRGELSSMGNLNIKNLCFDGNTKNLYFNYDGKVEDSISHFVSNPGFYILPPVNGKYKKENIQRITTIKRHELDTLLRVKTYNGVTDYKSILNYIKNACAPKYSPDEIYFSIKELKNYPSSNFHLLYETDTSGNPLTEEDALEFLFSSLLDRKYQFYNLCNYYSCSNDFEHGFPEQLVPLENLLFVKKTGESAYTPNPDYLHSIYSSDSGYLFSNKDGLWGIYCYNWVYMTIYHITDNKGNFIKRQDDKFNEIKLKGIYDPTRDNILISDNYFLFLPNDNKKIYCVKNSQLFDLSFYFKDTQTFTYDHLVQLNDNELITSLCSNRMVNKINNSRYTNLILIFSIIAGLLILSIIILIFRMRFYKKNKNLIRDLKKNKKDIFEIQEKERGRVSRDIHDSVIQDIRSIRLNSEMLNVTQDSQDRKQQIIKMATDCIVNLRNICYNLTPAELTTHVDGDNSKLELVSIIQTLVTQFIERTHVPCSIQIDESFSYPTFEKDVSQNLFRIIQEILTNIEKHSYATQCSIFIRSKENDKYMAIYVSDDGIGCDIKNIMRKTRKTHFGLQNIKERAALIGAELEFISNPGEGMETRIIIPINKIEE